MTFSRKRIRRISALAAGSLVFQAAVSPLGWAASRAIPGLFGGANALPAPLRSQLPTGGTVVQGATVDPVTGSLMVIRQNQPKAIVDWLTFDVGEGAQVRFDQKLDGKAQTDWVALNRIHDGNPSQIFGRLSADGKVYLINQNGILFGPTATVNLHSLTASSLNIKNEDFLADALYFGRDSGGNDVSNYQGTGKAPGAVSNHGQITTDSLGSVFLFAPQVENNGVITTPSGQICLAAGTTVFLSNRSDGRGLLVKLTAPEGSTATNFELGRLLADTGLVGMHGWAVNQDGLIRATTAVRQNGVIELRATHGIATGPTSVTETPISASNERVNESFAFSGGSITLQGLDDPVSGSPTATGLIDHEGLLSAPAGKISLQAAERVFLDGGSKIDVSGTWLSEPAFAATVTATLNSVQLRDDQQQKGGPLKGQTVTVDPLQGTAIGDISDSLFSRDSTAQERSVAGGEISIGAYRDVVMKAGAEVAFAGGGIHYLPGGLATTELLSGTNVYGIGSAPEGLAYEGTLTNQRFRSSKFGSVDTYAGLYLGGTSPLPNLSPGHTEGADAGSLHVIAPVLVLEGKFDGRATAGEFQTKKADPTNALGLVTARGLRMPVGGTMVIGNVPAGAPEQTDAVVTALQLTGIPPQLPDRFGPGDPLPEGQVSTVSSASLSEAGLAQLRLNANLNVTVDDSADLRLAPGGTLIARSRGIEVRGQIDAPAGTVDLATISNITSPDLEILPPNYQPVAAEERVLVASGAGISVAGLTVDRSKVPGGSGAKVTGEGLLNGGAVVLQDETNGRNDAVVAKGAQVSADGGYEVAPDASVKAGNAGSVSLIGSTVALGGDIHARSLLGANGGKLTLQAETVTVGPVQAEPGWDAAGRPVTRPVVDPATGAAVGNPKLPDDFGFGTPMPTAMLGHLVLDPSSLKGTGFTSLDVRASYGLVVSEGVELRPDATRLSWPVSRNPGSATPIGNSALPVALGWSGGVTATVAASVGSSSVKLSVGKGLPGKIATDASATDNARVLVAPGATVETGPGGTIAISAAGVDVAGNLIAPGGQISVTASGGTDPANAPLGLGVWDGAVLSARGYTVPAAAGTQAAGTQPRVQVFDAGQISLTVAAGDLTLEKGTTIDVSGSNSGFDWQANADGTIRTWEPAGKPGSIQLQYARNLAVEGSLLAEASVAGLPGGALQISRMGHPRVGQAPPLTLDAALAGSIAQWAKGGFDAFVLASDRAIALAGPIDLTVGRSLTLDAPVIEAVDGTPTSYHLASPWTVWRNSSGFEPPAASGGNASLKLSGGWVDLNGELALQGFQDVEIAASQDLRLTERQLFLGGGQVRWVGALDAPNLLTLEAQRIYPVSESHFRIKALDAEIRRPPGIGVADRPINSAGGELDIEAERIVNEGTLAAPMGTIKVQSTEPGGQIVLAEGSRTSATGNAMVDYGGSSALEWSRSDRSSTTSGARVDVTAAPTGSVELVADQILVQTGAVVLAGGGGGIASHFFAPGIEGSTNPLGSPNTYVILPANPLSNPGDAVYLSGNKEIADGLYSLLPTTNYPGYAFLPGALVVTDLSTTAPAGNSSTPLGYPVVKGYRTFVGTDVRPSALQAFSLRPAADVIKEGNFTNRSFESADGGLLSVSGPTTVFNGTIDTGAVHGGADGTVRLVASNIEVRPTAPAVPTNGMLTIAASTLSGGKIGQLKLGDSSSTESVTITGGSDVSASAVQIGASHSIVVESGAKVEGVGVRGSVALVVPNGAVGIQAGGSVAAESSVSIDAGSLTVSGTFSSAGGSLSVSGTHVVLAAVAPEEAPAPDQLVLTQDLIRAGGFSSATLKGRSDLTFVGDLDLAMQSTLTLDAPRISGSGTSVQLAGGTVVVQNSATSADGGSAAHGSTSLSLGGDSVVLSQGAVVLAGFGDVKILSKGDLTFEGQGTLSADANVELQGARLTGGALRDATGSFLLANHTVDAGTGTLHVSSSGGTPGTGSTAGAKLELTAAAVQQDARIDLPAGTVVLAATGPGSGDGVTLGEGASVTVAGTKDFGGGSVTLSSENGLVSVAKTASIDLSAWQGGASGDAGSLTVSAPNGAVSLQGAITALPGKGGGRGGSFALQTSQFGGDSVAVADLVGILTAGGFTGTLDLRADTGDVVLPAGATLRGQEVSLAADSGRVRIDGVVDASGPGQGGRVVLAAAGDVVVGGLLSAKGGTAGGRVELSSDGGTVAVTPAAIVDVSGGGGEVAIRAPRTSSNDGVNVALAGTFIGATRVQVEGVKSYDVDTAALNDPATRNVWNGDNAAFVDNVAAGNGNLFNAIRGSVDPAVFHLMPGLELRSAGSLALTADWDLTTWRYGASQVPGVLTLAAQGDLTIQARLADHPTAAWDLPTASTPGNSWSLRVVAGASGTGPLAVNSNGSGSLEIPFGGLVYSEGGNVAFGSGGNTTLGPGFSSGYMDFVPSMDLRYNVGSYSGTVRGRVGGTLEIDAGAVQSAVGEISVAVGRDLVLHRAPELMPGSSGDSLGSIRTTGLPGGSPSAFWLYQDGGDIHLSVGGRLTSTPLQPGQDPAAALPIGFVSNQQNDGWDNVVTTRDAHRRNVTFWTASYQGEYATEGVATMGGGDIEIEARDGFFGQAGAFGTGSLNIRAGGDVSGRFLVREGRLDISTLGSYGTGLKNNDLELFDTQAQVRAQGDVSFGTAVNPTLALPGLGNTNWASVTYTERTSLRVASTQGDLTMSGSTRLYDLTQNPLQASRVLPATVELSAGRDLIFGDPEFTGSGPYVFGLMPAPDGNLVLSAGRDILGGFRGRLGGSSRMEFIVSDLDPASLYGIAPGNTTNPAGAVLGPGHKTGGLLHQGDETPLVIHAGRDVRDLIVMSPKEGDVRAGANIVDLAYEGQNVRDSDVTRVAADGSIRLGTRAEFAGAGSGFTIGGPGGLVVQGGTGIDLGSSGGIQSVANQNNQSLPQSGASLVVTVGDLTPTTPDEMRDLFKKLRSGGAEYSDLLAAGEVDKAKQKVDEIRHDLIVSTIGEPAARSGTLEMTRSQISTQLGGDIYIAVATDANVGQSTFTSESQKRSTGVFTAFGGEIGILTGESLNVNEARVMTFLGGNITAWADSGNINAGRGSKAAINASPPQLVCDTGGINCRLVFQPPAVGSGIRTLTYDPDGFEGPLQAPDAGDVSLFAPSGDIDAGEAGIAGKNVILAALHVLNVQNISFSSGSVGVPIQSQGLGLGALAGSGAVADAQKQAQAMTTAALDQPKAAQTQGGSEEMSQMFTPKSLKVDIVGFDEDDADPCKDKESEACKNKEKEKEKKK